MSQQKDPKTATNTGVGVDAIVSRTGIVGCNLEITGSKASVFEFLQLIQFIMCAIRKGSCESLNLVVDGDGSANLHFKIDGEEFPIPQDGAFKIKNGKQTLWIGA